jgi:hypothetical protein
MVQPSFGERVRPLRVGQWGTPLVEVTLGAMPHPEALPLGSILLAHRSVLRYTSICPTNA